MNLREFILSRSFQEFSIGVAWGDLQFEILVVLLLLVIYFPIIDLCAEF